MVYVHYLMDISKDHINMSEQLEVFVLVMKYNVVLEDLDLIIGDSKHKVLYLILSQWPNQLEMDSLCQLL